MVKSIIKSKVKPAIKPKTTSSSKSIPKKNKPISKTTNSDKKQLEAEYRLDVAEGKQR